MSDLKELTITLPAGVVERLETYAGTRSLGRVARECLVEGLGRRMATGVPAVRHANPTRGGMGPALIEENRNWWERFARRNLVPRRVASFLLGRSSSYVSELARAMGADGWRLNLADARGWLEAHPDFRASPRPTLRRRRPGLVIGSPPVPAKSDEPQGSQPDCCTPSPQGT